ncbi:major capsid protein [Paenibacillus camelliae]|uniref:major capsid protein n=1 Tax=Paenibacillus camelliae TaxID=512410 RepID=UPI002041C116|nr:major capsid protein [Paenibacillus camelliae]MCM3632940.1 major capsid protein [Paenibacillus camelliae]
MAVKDIYSRPTLLKVVGQLPPVSTYILDTFFQTGEAFDTEEVEIQTLKGSKPIAPYVSELQPGKVIVRTGFTAQWYKPALVKPARVITGNDLKIRRAGENLINPVSPEVRARQLVARDIIELNETITRRKVQQAAELIFTGKVTQVGEGVSQVIDYDFTNIVTVASADKWDQATSDPIKWLAAQRKKIMDANAPTPDIVLADYNAAVALMRHEKILKLADNRGVDVGNIDVTLLPDGVTYHGYLRDVGFHVYSYTGTYTNDEGQEVPFIPAGHVAIMSSREKFSFHYGAIMMMDDNEEFALFRGEVAAQSWVTKEPAQRWLQLLSKPLPVPYNVDGWIVAKVLT